MRYKYPRTYHLPWSEGATSDDKILDDTSIFEGELVVVTEKMDGENTTMYRDGIHARSLDSNNHLSRNWVKGFHAGISYKFDEVSEYYDIADLRVCGENLFAQHSIKYDNLLSYFYGFSAWDGEVCLDWDKTVTIFNRLGITPVPRMYYALYNEKWIRMLTGYQEGYVVRLAATFHMDDFSESVAKFVRKGHVQTDEHWMNKAVVPNGLL